MKIKDFAIPTSLAEAHRLLKDLGPNGLPVAGGTAHLFLRGDDEKVAVDISRLGLSGIRATDSGFEIGATTHIADLQHFQAPGWVLDRVARCFVSQQLRNAATLGGNVVRVFAWADFPAPLLVLDASFVLQGASERVIDAATFFNGQPVRLLQPGDLLTAVRVPAVKPPDGFAYIKQGRTAVDYGLVTAAAWIQLDGSRVAAARVAVGASVATPRRLNLVEEALTGKALTPQLIEAAVKQGWTGPVRRASPGVSEDYVRHVTAVVLRDAIRQAGAEAKGGAS